MKKYESKYYVIYTDLGEDGAKETSLRMTRMAEEYYNRTKEFSGRINKKFPFYLFKKPEDYYAAGGLPGSAGVFMGGADKLMAIAVDNDGGGIFSFLPQAEALGRPRFEQLFGTPHGVDLSLLAAAHGLVTLEPAGAEDVRTAVATSVAAGGVRLVRAPTVRGANVAVHDEIHSAVAAALDAR